MDVILNGINALATCVTSLTALVDSNKSRNLQSITKFAASAFEKSNLLIKYYQSCSETNELSQWFRFCKRHELLLIKVERALQTALTFFQDHKLLEWQLEFVDGHLSTVRSALWALRARHGAQSKGHEKVELVKKCFVTRIKDIHAEDIKKIKSTIHPDEVPGIFWRLENREGVDGKLIYTFEQLTKAKQNVYQILAKPEIEARDEHRWRIFQMVIAAIFLTPFSLIWTLPWLEKKRQDVIVKKAISVEELDKIRGFRRGLKNSSEMIILATREQDEKEQKLEEKTEKLCNKSGELRKWFQDETTLFMTANQAQRFNLVAAMSGASLSPEKRAKLQAEIKESKKTSCRQVVAGYERLRT